MTTGSATPHEPSFADQAFAATANAYAAAPESWERAVRAAIAGLFDFLAARPAQAKACIAEDLGRGSAALAQRDRTIDRFVELLRPGFDASTSPPPPVVAEAIGGGIYELIRNHALEQRLEELPDAAAGATVLALSPFIGQDAAIALAESAGVRANG